MNKVLIIGAGSVALFAADNVKLEPEWATVNATEFDEYGNPLDGERFLCFNDSMELWETSHLPDPWVNGAYTFVNGIFTLDEDSDAWKSYLVEQNPPVPIPASVTMRQARIALNRAGKLAGVAAAIASLPEPQRTEAGIEWEFSSVVERNRPLTTMLGAALGLNPGQLDQLFVTASQIN